VATFDDIDLEAMGPVTKWLEEHGPELSGQMPGYEGAISLLDRQNKRAIEIFLFDNEANARTADELLDEGPPAEMPEELKEVALSGTRSFRGVFQVTDADGLAAGVLEGG
jgi:hypothetical protein